MVRLHADRQGPYDPYGRLLGCRCPSPSVRVRLSQIGPARCVPYGGRGTVSVVRVVSVGLCFDWGSMAWCALWVASGLMRRGHCHCVGMLCGALMQIGVLVVKHD